MTRWQTPVFALCAVALVLVSGCGRDDAGPSRTASPAPIVRGAEYVAIGDSYTGAPETGPNAADDGCLQSTTNYPHRVARKLGLDLTDGSCGGATTQHVREPQVIGTSENPPQGDALSADTALVTISLGGNDFNSFGAVILGCSTVAGEDPAGAPCTDADTADGTSVIDKNLGLIKDRLVDVIQYTASRAPRARIIVVGYPEFFPTSGPCDQLPIAAGDFALARRVNEGLVEAQEEAADAAGVEYIDVFGPTTGHNMCADDPWIAGAAPTRTDAMIYHPYPEEQKVVADLLLKRLTARSAAR